MRLAIVICGAGGLIVHCSILRCKSPNQALISIYFRIHIAGFDAAEGDPLGGMAVTADCYGWMTRELMKVQRDARVVMALEGGYNLTSISKAAVACVGSLLRIRFPVGSYEDVRV